MKEHAKLYKAQRQRTVHTLSKRLGLEKEKDGDLKQDAGAAEKMKDHAKLYKAQRQRTVHTLSKRLQHEEV